MTRTELVLVLIHRRHARHGHHHVVVIMVVVVGHDVTIGKFHWTLLLLFRLRLRLTSPRGGFGITPGNGKLGNTRFVSQDLSLNVSQRHWIRNHHHRWCWRLWLLFLN